MCTDERVSYVQLHHLGVLPINIHTIDLTKKLSIIYSVLYSLEQYTYPA